MLLMQINPTEASHNKRVLTTRRVSPVETLKIINRPDSAVCYFDIADTPRRAFWVTCCVSLTLTGLTRHGFFSLRSAFSPSVDVLPVCKFIFTSLTLCFWLVTFSLHV